MISNNNNGYISGYEYNPPDFDSIDKTDVIFVNECQDEKSQNTKPAITSESLHNDFDSDVLPSFQMHNFMFNRALTDVSLSNDLLPEYEESVSDTIASSAGLSYDQNSTLTLDPAKSLLNNLDKLQRINLPFEAKVTLTKEIPVFDKPYVKENPLKTYYPGEMVYGFIIFENISQYHIPFEMFLVSMECEIGVKNPNGDGNIKKKIMTMYDLEASFNILGVDEYDVNHNRFDPVDKARLGFEKRSLDPGSKIKKFFRFKIPNYVLDDCCSDQITEHLKTPPSYGLNRTIWKDTASSIKVNPVLGYGSLGSSGSPILANDYALGGEYCSFFINAQIIGKKLEEYKPFYTKDTTHQYDFIFIKNVEHYFRVGKSQLNDTEFNHSTGTTIDQLESFERTAIEAMEVLSEREMLQKIDITDRRTQDEIIFSTSGKRKSCIEENEKCLSKLQISNEYSDSMEFEFKKDFFSKVNGKLKVTCALSKDATIESFSPKLLESKPINILQNISYMKAVSPTLKLDLTYVPTESTEDISKLPKSIVIKPNIISASFQSPYCIPFNIDKDFLLNDYKTIRQNLACFPLYFNKLHQMMRDSGNRIPKSTYDLLRGLGYCKYDEFQISNVFKPHTVDLSDSWKFNAETGFYHCSTEISLELDVKSILATPKVLLPSFQTCLFARMYKVRFDISPKKSKLTSTTFPITVI